MPFFELTRDKRAVNSVIFERAWTRSELKESQLQLRLRRMFFSAF